MRRKTVLIALAWLAGILLIAAGIFQMRSLMERYLARKMADALRDFLPVYEAARGVN